MKGAFKSQICDMDDNTKSSFYPPVRHVKVRTCTSECTPQMEDVYCLLRKVRLNIEIIPLNSTTEINPFYFEFIIFFFLIYNLLINISYYIILHEINCEFMCFLVCIHTLIIFYI